VQNCRINLDFDLFLQRKNGGPRPRVGEKGEELRGSSPRALVDDSTARRARRR
jgi:hypothetical protein